MLRSFSLLLLGITFCGCGGGPNLVPVSGKVTLDGQPAKEGSVSFVQEGGPKPIGVGALVLDGQYALSKTNGLSPGKYRVEVRIPIPTGKTLVDPDTHEKIQETKEGAARQFNTMSNLTADVSTSSTVFDFEVTSK